MTPEKRGAPPSQADSVRQWFPAVLGTFLGLALLKFGNPPIMEKWVTPPTNAYEFFLNAPWPAAWAYWLLGVATIAGLFCFRRKPAKAVWPLALGGLWLAWQFVAAAWTVDMKLTEPTVAHFCGCIVCLFLGCYCLASCDNPDAFFLGLMLAYLLVLVVGFQQHFGGLEQTRRYFFLYLYPEMKEVSPEYLKKISSRRIFSTLFYPNALAGALLLLLPAITVILIRARRRFTSGARVFLVCTVGAGSLACLFWSGSKGGWLLMLLLGLLALLCLNFDRRLKLGLVGIVLVSGLAGFGLKYHSFFRQGASSVVARFDYWGAALRTAADHPWFGTGPGTFAKPYQNLKRPESEMARLVHNDYLEQASDSGWIGFAAFAGFVITGLIYSYPRATKLQPQRLLSHGSELAQVTEPGADRDWLRLAVWLGLLGWALQGVFEFGLYIPGLAWPAFCLLGWLLGSRVAGKP